MTYELHTTYYCNAREGLSDSAEEAIYHVDYKILPPQFREYPPHTSTSLRQ
jgi:hypothetical protein